LIRHVLKKGATELGLKVSATVTASLELFTAELLKWNNRVNLTAITTIDEIAIKHFLDSLVLAEHITGADTMLDIGSGAGIPAIPVKILKPELKVVSVDAVGKKIHFQRHVARLLQLEEFEAVHARVEKLPSSYDRSFDLITSRAFSDLRNFVEIAHPFLADGGRIVAMKGSAAADEIKSAESVISAFGYEIYSQYNYWLPFGMGERNLITIAACKGR